MKCPGCKSKTALRPAKIRESLQEALGDRGAAPDGEAYPYIAGRLAASVAYAIAALEGYCVTCALERVTQLLARTGMRVHVTDERTAIEASCEVDTGHRFVGGICHHCGAPEVRS